MRELKILEPSQEAAIDRLYQYDHTLFIAPKGFGKTVVAWTAMDYLRRDNICKKFLILGTGNICVHTWADEWQQWEHLQHMDELYMNAGKVPLKLRERICDAAPDFLTLNFENIPWFFERFGHDHGYDGLLVDEMTLLKNVGGESYKVLRKHIKDFTWRAGMTAAPAQQDPLDLYGQTLIIDGGDALGTSQERYRRKYFYPLDRDNRKWALHPGSMEKITDALSSVLHQPIDFHEREAYNVKIIDHEIVVDMNSRSREAYIEMCKDYINEEKDISAANAAVKRGKMHQLACGAMYDNDKNTHWFHKSKYKAVRDIYTALDSPVMIVYQYEFELRQLKKLFDGLNKQTGCIGNVRGRYSTGVVDAWNDGRLPVLLVHPRSCSHGLNLQKGPGHTIICMSYLDSADGWEQIGGRIARRGQKADHVDRYTIISKGTLEETVMPQKLGLRKNISISFHEHVARLSTF